MKKTWITSMIILIFSPVFSQEDEVKDFRFGLNGNVSIDWLSPEEERDYSRYKTGLGYGWGLQMEFKINETNSLVVGMNLTTFKAGLNYNDSEAENFDSPYHSTYYSYVQGTSEFQKWENLDTLPQQGDIYQLKTRKYKINYVTIPLSIKMKTKEIGYMTYFGQFGANLGLKTKARVNDESDLMNWNASDSTFSHVAAVNITDLDLAKGTQPIRIGLLVGGGAEYNFSGSTSMFFALHYHYYVTNALTREAGEDYLRSFNPSSESFFKKVGAKSIPGSISLTVGVLF